jgi:hypothetical protein
VDLVTHDLHEHCRTPRVDTLSFHVLNLLAVGMIVWMTNFTHEIVCGFPCSKLVIVDFPGAIG